MKRGLCPLFLYMGGKTERLMGGGIENNIPSPILLMVYILSYPFIHVFKV
jgi:hypothetical protein